MKHGSRHPSLLGISVFLLLALLCPAGTLAAETAPYPRRDAVVIAVEEASPAVVNISAEQIHEQRTPFARDRRDPFFDPFFEDFFDSFAPRKYKTQSLGSGVIISPEGYILTNDHVATQGSRITVRLINKEEYPATLVGSDPKSDLAVLRIETEKPLPYIRMGRSDDLMIGETVIAIGNPFGLSHTVTTGVISALNRTIRSENRVYQDFIQTDASINPGNSGGPLLNINGKLIGVNTAIYQKAQGIGFAIPINRAKRIYEDLVAYGEVHKPWLGIFLQDLTPQVTQYFGLSNRQGVLISRVVKGDPADLAGLKEGDIVVRIGSKEVQDRESYLTLIEGYRPGATISMTVLREGTTTLKVSITSREITPEAILAISWEWLGLEVREMPAAAGKGAAPGVVVTRVNRHSDAYRIGLRTGDLIRRVNNTAITDIASYRKALEQALNSENVVLLVVRANKGYYVTLGP